MLILVVDDDAEDLELFHEAMEQIDPSIICIEAYNGLDALKILKRDSILPDYIFLDINMPFMNGLKCLEEIKSDGSLKDIPVTMYSTSTDQKEIEKCKKLGAEFLVKPNSYSALLQSLTSLLGRTAVIH